MRDDATFSLVLTGLRGGDDAAAAVVFHRYARRLVALACRRFDNWLGARVDAEDIIQSVFRTFFQRCERGQFELDGWENLWALLAVITLRKCGAWRDHQKAHRRDVNREARQHDPGMFDFRAFRELKDRQPSPLEAALLTDLVSRLLQDLDSESRRIAEMTLQGFTAEETSDRLGRSERTIWRVRRRLRGRLQRLTEEPDDAPGDLAQRDDPRSCSA